VVLVVWVLLLVLKGEEGMEEKRNLEVQMYELGSAKKGRTVSGQKRKSLVTTVH